jgi:DNA-binding transcriptional LysR family regulator
MHEFSIRQLRHFVFVAECGSFRAAAERAFRSQSALTLSIQELENQLGAHLFEVGRRAELTDFGRQCLPIAREMVDQFAEQSMRLGSISSMPSVTIAVLPSFASRWLPEFLSVFSARHSDIALRVLDGNSRTIEELVIGARADIGIVSLGAADRRFVTKPLLTDEFGLICHRSDPLARAATLPWSKVDRRAVLGNLTHQLLAGGPAAPYVQAPRMFVSNMTSLLSLIANGGWVSPLPVLAVPAHARDVVAVPLRRPRVVRQIALIRLKAKPLTPAVAKIEAIVDEILAAERARTGGT